MELNFLVVLYELMLLKNEMNLIDQPVEIVLHVILLLLLELIK